MAAMALKPKECPRCHSEDMAIDNLEGLEINGPVTHLKIICEGCLLGWFEVWDYSHSHGFHNF